MGTGQIDGFVKRMARAPGKGGAMRMWGKVGDRCSKTGIAVLALLFAGIVFGGLAVAQTKRTGGPTPSPSGAEVYFIDLKDGATVPAKLKVYFGLRNMGVAPAGSDRENSGHHHLLIDTELPPLDQPIPNDFNHLHFGAGQTEAEITLKPGQHTLQLLLGDKNHIPHTPPVTSARIRVNVAPTGGPTASAPDASTRTPAPADARVYFVGLQDGSVLPQKATIHFGLVNMGVAPAGIEKSNTGHHHLLIDAKLPPLDQPIPNDFNHLHFGAGQSEATVDLPLGKHTLQLLLGDANHIPHNPPVMSKPIEITVVSQEQDGRSHKVKVRRQHNRSQNRNRTQSGWRPY
jgi:hypothetical protein